MTIEWLAGNRLRGTTAERPNFGLPSGSVGGWVEVGRTTLGSAGDTIDVTSLPNKRYYMVLHNSISTGNVTSSVRLNGDSGNNYAWRYNDNGGSDGTITSNNAMNAGDRNPPTGGDAWAVSYLANKSGKEKLMYSFGLQRNSAGAGTAPTRGETASKWTGTNVIDQITSVNQESGDWASGSEMVVLGYDPSDTHTTNFWEELADTTFTSSGVSAQTFTAKKYIWCQFWFTSDASGNGQYFQLGDTGGIDTGSTYARRFSINGGSDSTSANQSKIYFAPQTGAVTHFVNMFIVNNASNEKLVIVHATTNNGAGAGNASQRRETVGKWVETTNQCDRITIATDAGTFTGGQLKVWGAD